VLRGHAVRQVVEYITICIHNNTTHTHACWLILSCCLCFSYACALVTCGILSSEPSDMYVYCYTWVLEFEFCRGQHLLLSEALPLQAFSAPQLVCRHVDRGPGCLGCSAAHVACAPHCCTAKGLHCQCRFMDVPVGLWLGAFDTKHSSVHWGKFRGRHGRQPPSLIEAQAAAVWCIAQDVLQAVTVVTPRYLCCEPQSSRCPEYPTCDSITVTVTSVTPHAFCFTHVVEHTSIYQTSVRSGQRLPIS